MKRDLLQLINDSPASQDIQKNLDDIFSLYENIQYSHSIDSLMEIIYKWFYTKYNIKNFKVTFYNLEIDFNQIIYQKGEDFYLDNDFCKNFIVEIHYYKNLIIAINADNKEDFDIIEKDLAIL
ncbi:MAG: hypothetical protein GX118_08120, partial [Arcobacter butzleri]|nr:hypothetical protein [Aliarcobacter butzleri]